MSLRQRILHTVKIYYNTYYVKRMITCRTSSLEFFFLLRGVNILDAHDDNLEKKRKATSEKCQSKLDTNKEEETERTEWRQKIKSSPLQHWKSIQANLIEPD